VPAGTALVRALHSAGPYEDAVAELRRMTPGDERSPVVEATSAWALNRLGRLRPAITAMRRAYPEFMASGGEHLPVEIRRVIFPVAYWGLLRQHAVAQDLDPYLVAALVAQESTFQADVRSAADAWGLMQIIPSTGSRYAGRLGLSGFTTASLTDPEMNVRIGTTYLVELIDMLGGVAPALAG